MIISKQTIQLSKVVWEQSSKESKFYPIDRFFIEHYLLEIKKLNPLEFIVYNFNNFSMLYSSQLFMCLPEVWEELDTDDLIKIIGSLKNSIPIYSLILFTYKYLQIDLIQLVFQSSKLSDVQKNNTKDYLRRQYNNLILYEDDIEDFTDDCLGISYSEWGYSRQRFLTDKTIKRAKRTEDELKIEIEKYI